MHLFNDGHFEAETRCAQDVTGTCTSPTNLPRCIFAVPNRQVDSYQNHNLEPLAKLQQAGKTSSLSLYIIEFASTQNLDIMVQDWKAKADAKRDAILKSIPEKWRLQNLPSNKEKKDVTVAYVHQFLDKKEIEITETDAVGIARKAAAGTWSAVDIAQAFCHRASIAHQLVSWTTLLQQT
jgi:hypothetical protein